MVGAITAATTRIMSIKLVKRAIKITLFIVYLLTAALLIWFFVPTYKHSYYRSANGRVTVTSINYDGQTYITYGKYSKNDLPENYIRPLYAGFNSGFEAMLYFEGDTGILYSRYGAYDSVGVNNKLKVKVFNKAGDDPLFLQMLDDNSGKYHLLHD
jgi:hypothetical protein